MTSIRWTALCVAGLALIGVSAARGEPSAAAPATRAAMTAADLEAITTRLTLRPSAAARGVVKFKLLPDLADQVPGNAATLYLMAREFWPDPQKTSELLYPEDHRFDYQETPIDQFPRKYGEALLAGYATTLKYVDAAARRREANWDTGWGDPTFRADAQALTRYLNDLRHAANLVAFRTSLRISQGDWDGAADSLRSGFALARHSEPSLVPALVASGFVQISVYRGVEPWVARGESPNLYWALTDLPEPFIDLRAVAQAATIESRHWRPQVARAMRGELPAEQWPEVIREMVETLSERQGPRKPDAATVEADVKKLLASTQARARKALAAEGMTDEQVREMPAEQAVGSYLCREYTAATAEAWKGWALPYWQAERQMLSAWKALAPDQPPLAGNPLVQAELVQYSDGRADYRVPQVLAARFQLARADRYVSLMRTIEAIRDYAARHKGRLPERLDQITDLPLPLDPVTGRPFAYAVNGETAVLDAPAPAWRGFRSGVRYELRMAK
jgi:hypothetical protein